MFYNIADNMIIHELLVLLCGISKTFIAYSVNESGNPGGGSVNLIHCFFGEQSLIASCIAQM